MNAVTQPVYNHQETAIDIRDKHVISYNSKSKRFITEASTLKANDISPTAWHYTIGGWKQVIWLYSHKLDYYICYRFSRRECDAAGEVVADVFTPHFGVLSGGNSSKAHTASLGTELHILND